MGELFATAFLDFRGRLARQRTSARINRSPNHREPVGGSFFAASLAMVGPGAWSLDARLFDRKRIHTPDL